MKKWVFLCGCAFAFELLPVAASAAPAVEIPGVPWTSLKAVSGKKGETVDILDGSGRCVLAFHVQPSKAKIAQALKVAVREDCLEFDLRGAFKAGARSVRLGSLDLDPKDYLGRDLALVSVFTGSEGACASGLAVPGGELGERKKYWDVRGPRRRILPVPTRLESSTLVPTNLTVLYVKNDFTSPGDGPIRYYGTRLGSADILTDEPPVRHGTPKPLFAEPADTEMSGVRTYPIEGNLDPLRGAISLWMKRRKPASGVFFELCSVFPDGRAAKAGDGALRFGWNADRIFWERGDYAESAFSPVSALTPFKADVWQHYVLTWDELGCSVYIDGKPVPPAKTSDSLNPVKRALWKAQNCVFRDGWTENLRNFKVAGETRDLEVWSAPLSRAQVRARFAELTHAPQGENGWSTPWRNPAGAPPPNVAMGATAKVAGVPEGMRLVADVSAADIARSGDTNVFRSTGAWKIGTCAGVDYLEAGPAQFDRFALRFTFEKTASLVCFEVTYPDDKARATEVTVVNAAAPYSDWGLQQGIETGLEHPVTGTNATKRFLYWPNGTGGDRKNDLGLTVMTIDDGCPAAISRVRAYVVDPARLPPAAPVASVPVAGRRRRFAIRFEDPAVVKDFGKGQLTLEDARVSIDRLAAYIRFTGADTFIYPGVWYAGPINDDYMPRIHQPHYLREFCRRFQRDGIGFVPSINQQWFPEIEDGITARTMTDGSLHASPVSILSTGCPNWGGWHFTPTYYNIAHPLVQESLMREVDRLVAECGDYASFKGVCLDLFNSINVGWWGSLDAGYNDYAVAAFEEAAKVKVRGEGEAWKGPLRGKLYSEKIQGDPALCEKWIAWRCDVLTDIYRRLVERIRAKRGDLELWVSAAPPWRPNMVDRPDLDDPQVADRMLREAGIDGRKLAKIPHLNLGILSMPSWWHDELHRAMTKPGLREKVRDLPETPGFYAPVRETSYPFALFHDSYYESSVGSSPSRRGRQRDGRLNGGWLLETPWRVSAFNASGREALRPYAKALADGDMMAYAKGGYVIGTLGTEDVLAPWMREFRSLPAVKFADVAGDWPKAVKLRRAVVDGQTWHYVVNTGFDGVTATLPAPVGEVSLQGYELKAIPPALSADFPPNGLDVGFALNLARPGVPPVTVTPETVSSRSVERRGGTTVVTWRGHPVCGPDFAAVAELTPQDGGWAWTFRYAGNADETRDVESVDFPVLEAPRSGRTGIVYPKSLGLEEHPDWTALKPGASVVSAKPISFRFIAACDGSANGLYLDERGARGFAGTLRAENGCKPGTVRLAARHDLAVTPASNRAFALPYGGTFRTFAGTWYDAAQIYRAWVKDQPWVVANRGKDRTKLRDIALWLWQRGLSEDVVAPAERFLDETGLRPAVDWYWWHKIPYDTQYPFFWPPREGEAAFRAAVARMKKRGIFSQVYTNGMSWDCDDPSWTTGGGREEVRYEKRGGEFLSRMYNVFTKHRLAHLCGEAPKFQAHFVDLAGTLAACGLDGLYMDQIGCGSLGSCWNPAHAHAPGGGRVVSDGYRALFRRIRAANPDLLLSTEEPNEEFLGEVDDVICLWQNAERFVKRGRQSCEPVPVYQALHHGETTLFGSFAILGGRTAWDPTWPEASRWRDEAAWDARHFSTDQFALEFVRGIVFGNQPCLHNLTLGQIADPRLADDWRFVKETAAFYHAHRDFLFDGRLLSPGRLTCERIAFDFVVRGTYTTEETLVKVKTESPAVLHSLWQAPDGRKALVLVNWTRQEQTYALAAPDATLRGTLAPRSWKLVSFTEKEIKK